MKSAAIACAASAAVLLIPMIAIAAIVGALFGGQVAAIACAGPVAAVSGQWRPPLMGGYTITSGFGMRDHPVLHRTKLHTGTDLYATGDKTIVAAADGRVKVRGFNTAYGNQVVLDHGAGIQTRYAHMSSLASLAVGQKIGAGTTLGVQGATGWVTGAHLHFEIIQDGQPINPEPFMAEHGAALNGRPVTTTANAASLPAGVRHEGGIGFALPAAGTPRRASVHTPAVPIPTPIKTLYVAAADKYKLPWTLLAGIGMEETTHGRNNHTSTAGAQGLMQFTPGTWNTLGVDGDGDGRVDITNDADSIFSAANYLTSSGVSSGAAGVRRALFAYNHANWYVNDVLFYAAAYGGGTVLGGVEDCGPHTAISAGDTDMAALADDRLRTVLAWANAHDGDAYVFGGNGPHAWDCSSFVQAAYRQAGITMPRVAGAQRDWLAAGNGHRIKPGTERRGDLIFWDSFLGPNQIGHVAMVNNPSTRQSIDARNSRLGVGHFTYSPSGKDIYQIWRVGNLERTR